MYPETENHHALLDDCRCWAEACCTDPETWQLLAEAYAELGRLSQSASCQARARHYAGKELVYATDSKTPA